MHPLKVLLITCLVLAGPYLPSAANAQKSKPPTPVIVQTAQTIEFRDRVEALGTLRSNESVALTAVVADKITAIKFEDGDRVEKNQVLVEMTTAEETAAVEEARSTLQEAKAQFERAESLTKRKLSPETVFDQRRRDYATSRARVAAMEARLSDRILKAPFAGVMGLRNVSVGGLVSPGDVIARIEDDSVMKLDFSVPSTFISTLKPGLEIVAKARGFANDEFRGTVASIDNRIDEITRTIKVRAILPNPDRNLVPGLLMNVNLFKNPRQSVAVAEEALVPIGFDTYVFVVDQDKMTVARRRIETGSRKPGLVEVTNGLKEGEVVVTDGTMNVKPGAVVTIVSKDTDENAAGSEPATAREQKASDKPAGRT